MDSRGVYRLTDLKSSCGTLFISSKSQRMFQLEANMPIKLQHGDAFAIGTMPTNKTMVDIFQNMFVFTFFKPEQDPSPCIPQLQADEETTDVDEESVASQVKEVLHEVESIIQCPVCFDLPMDARVLNCGHVLCIECLASWTIGHRSCPVCRAYVSDAAHKTRGSPCPAVSNAVRLVLERRNEKKTLAYHKEYQSHYGLFDHVQKCLTRKPCECEKNTPETEGCAKRKRVQV
jgi:hypothetical protein